MPADVESKNLSFRKKWIEDQLEAGEILQPKRFEIDSKLGSHCINCIT
jgi:hypothetical protein